MCASSDAVDGDAGVANDGNVSVLLRRVRTITKCVSSFGRDADDR